MIEAGVRGGKPVGVATIFADHQELVSVCFRTGHQKIQNQTGLRDRRLRLKKIVTGKAA